MDGSTVFDAADMLAAVKRERERCAIIAEEIAAVDDGELYVARQIADAIRSPPTEDDDNTEAPQAADIKAEHERCAKIAENPGFIQAQDTEWDEGVNFAKRFIAAAIRRA